MEDILSQSEIDLLIQASFQPTNDSETDVDSPNDSYDFTKPNKFSKDQLRGLQRVHEQFCRTYSGLMSAKLRTRFELKYQGIDQLTFDEFVRSLPNPSVLSILEANHLPGSIVVQISPDSAFMMHDRLCGGRGDTYLHTRSLSDIEMAVFKRQVITSFANLLSDAWREIDDIQFQLDQVESNPQFLQIASDRDIVVVISLNFEFNQVTDNFNICIPYRTIEPVLPKITQHRLFESLTPPDPDKLASLKEKVRSAILPVNVELGTATVFVSDLFTLEVGDVIELDRKRTENVDVKIGSLTKFKATPGKLGDKLGVVITSICEPPEE